MSITISDNLNLSMADSRYLKLAAGDNQTVLQMPTFAGDAFFSDDSAIYFRATTGTGLNYIKSSGVGALDIVAGAGSTGDLNLSARTIDETAIFQHTITSPNISLQASTNISLASPWVTLAEGTYIWDSQIINNLQLEDNRFNSNGSMLIVGTFTLDAGAIILDSTTTTIPTDSYLHFRDANQFIRSTNVGYLSVNALTEVLLQVDETTVLTVASTGVSTTGSVTATSFVIGANTLTTTEWAYLDGQDQAVKTTSTPTFDGLNIVSNAWTDQLSMDWGTPDFQVRLYAEANQQVTLDANTYLYIVAQNVLCGYFTSTGFNMIDDKGMILGSPGYTKINSIWGTTNSQRTGGTVPYMQCGQLCVADVDYSAPNYKAARFWLVCDGSDKAYSFNHGIQANPTIFIHSANQSTTEWIGFTHDQTDGVLSVGEGGFKFQTAADTDLSFFFVGTTNSGQLTWMEDEDWFNFADDIYLSKRIYYNPTPATDDTATGTVVQGTAGEALTYGQVVYLHSSGKYYKASGSSAATMPCIAVALGSISADATGSFLLNGYLRDDGSSWTVGGLIYVSASTAGAITQTIPIGSGNQIQRLGIAQSATVILFKPDLTVIEHA